MRCEQHVNSGSNGSTLSGPLELIYSYYGNTSTLVWTADRDYTILVVSTLQNTLTATMNYSGTGTLTKMNETNPVSYQITNVKQGDTITAPTHTHPVLAQAYCTTVNQADRSLTILGY